MAVGGGGTQSGGDTIGKALAFVDDACPQFRASSAAAQANLKAQGFGKARFVSASKPTDIAMAHPDAAGLTLMRGKGGTFCFVRSQSGPTDLATLHALLDAHPAVKMHHIGSSGGLGLDGVMIKSGLILHVKLGFGGRGLEFRTRLKF